MLFTDLAWCVFILAAIPALLFLWNLFLYRPPSRAGRVESASILIPARNEERCIESSVRAALAGEFLDLEVIVLDDHSSDGTAGIVRAIAATDSRLTLATAPLLPGGWCGKQFACATLATLATKPFLCFLDADVQLAPDQRIPAAGYRHETGTAAASLNALPAAWIPAYKRDAQVAEPIVRSRVRATVRC